MRKNWAYIGVKNFIEENANDKEELVNIHAQLLMERMEINSSLRSLSEMMVEYGVSKDCEQKMIRTDVFIGVGEILTKILDLLESTNMGIDEIETMGI